MLVNQIMKISVKIPDGAVILFIYLPKVLPLLKDDLLLYLLRSASDMEHAQPKPEHLISSTQQKRRTKSAPKTPDQMGMTIV